MSRPTVKVELDLDGDGKYANANSNITSDVIEVEFENGTDAFDIIAMPSNAKVIVDNSGENTAGKEGYYSPEHANKVAGLDRGTALRIQSTHTGEAGPLLGQEGIGDSKPCPLFDGANDFVNIHSSAFNTAFNKSAGTLLVWVKPSEIWTDGIERRFFSIHQDADNQVILVKDNSDNILWGYIAGGTFKLVTKAITPAGWIMLVITYDTVADEVKAYFNGVQEGSTQTGLGTWAAGNLSSTNTVLGAFDTAPTRVWNGFLAHAAVWTKALTSAEITNIFDAAVTQSAQILATQAGDLIGYWQLNEAGGLTVVDSSGNNHNGIYNSVSRTRSMYTGWIRTIRPTPDQYGTQRNTTFILEDGLQRARRKTNVPVEIQKNKTADELLVHAIQRAECFPPSATGEWQIQVAGHSELGVTTRLGETIDNLPNWVDFDTGDSVFAFSFDNMASSNSLYNLMKFIVESEQGRLFMSREGKFVFWRRSRLSETDASVQSFIDTMSAMRYAYGASVVNDVTVKFEPRVQVSGVATLATQDTLIEVPSNGFSDEVTIEYRDATGNRQSSDSVITPVEDVDYIPVFLDGSSASADINISSFIVGANSARIIFENTGVNIVNIQTGMVIRANNIITFFGRTVTSADDTTSKAAFGNLPLTIDAKLLSSPAEAASIASYRLLIGKDPHGELKGVTHNVLHNDILSEAGVRRVPGDRVTIGETQTGQQGDYIIVKERHSIRKGVDRWDVEWTLEQASPIMPWRLEIPGRSNVEQSTILGV